jgi:hypothetical protein
MVLCMGLFWKPILYRTNNFSRNALSSYSEKTGMYLTQPTPPVVWWLISEACPRQLSWSSSGGLERSRPVRRASLPCVGPKEWSAPTAGTPRLGRCVEGFSCSGVTQACFHLDEFTFRFKRRKSATRGKLFFRLVQLAMQVGPAPMESLLKPQPAEGG